MADPARYLKPAIAGFIVGCIGLVIPGVLGTGYGFVQAGLDRQALLAIPLWMVLILPFAKILATSLSIGSGGSGGIFGPGMFIGGMLGAGIWRLLEPIAPAIPFEPAPFVIVAMMALFGSVAHAPLAVMLMVAEMTGNLSMLAPAMVAVGLATFVVGSRTIYRSQLATRADSPAQRSGSPCRCCGRAGRRGRSAGARRGPQPTRRWRPPGRGSRWPVSPGHRSSIAMDRCSASSTSRRCRSARPGAARRGCGRSFASPSWRRTTDSMMPSARSRTIDARGRRWSPTGDSTGSLSVRDAMSAYRTALSGNVRQRARAASRRRHPRRRDRPADPRLAGQRVSDVPWPQEAVVVAIERHDGLLVPRGDVTLEPGDRISVYTTPTASGSVEALFGTARAAVDASVHAEGALLPDQ